jgi:hypothetical protein
MPVMKAPETSAIELAAAIAPRHQLLISCGLLAEGSEEKDPTHDFPATGFPFIQEVYRRAGFPDRVKNVHLADEAHDFGPTKRKAAYAFFAEALQLERVDEDLEALTIELPETLEVFNAAHPLPENALHGSAAIAEAFERLPRRE